MKYLLLAIPFLLVVFSCNKEEKFTTSGGDQLEFSVDTLHFDTVFTELGSATRFFRVYNRHSESIRISSISLKGNDQSKFNLNVDGVPGDSHEDVVVYPKDSIYVFAEVTIDPDAPLSVSPYFVLDEVVFETNGNTQSVYLEAWGQNANYLPTRWHKDSVAVYTCNGEVTFDDPKPYVIFGIVAYVDCQVNIPAGARIHVHGGLSRGIDPASGESLIYNSGRLVIGQGAKLKVLGTIEDPVVFEGDRLEEGFEDADGQWTGIIFSAGSTGNVIENAVIKNSLFGMFVDSTAEVSLKNVQLYNTSGPGLFSYHSKVSAENCLFHSNGTNAIQLTYGGDYNFDYCTFANYGTDGAAVSMGNGVCDDPDNCTAATARVFRLNALFRNSIVFGSTRDEIVLSDFTGMRGDDRPMLNYTFDHCIVRTKDIADPDNGIPTFYDYCNDCLNADPSDAIFASVNEDDYHLDTLSVAEQKAVPLDGILFDLEGNERDVEMPDLGCYEYQFN